MRVALINPRWTFEGSIYFGCRDPHLPLEHGYAKAMLEARGHEVLLIDAHLMDLSLDEVRAELQCIRPRDDRGHDGADLSVLALRAARAARAEADGRGNSGRRRRPRGGRSARLGDAALPCSRSSASTSSSWASARRPSRGSQMARRRSCQASACGMAAASGSTAARRRRRSWIRLPCFWPDELIRRHRAHHHRFDRPPARSGRRGRGVARLPVPLLLLRQGAVSQPVPPAQAGCASGRDRRAARARRRVPLLHRRDLPAQPAAARGAGRRATSCSACRPGSICGSRR